MAYTPNPEPTQEQKDKLKELSDQGYKVDIKDSISACGVVLKKGNDTWFFGLDGEIEYIGES